NCCDRAPYSGLLMPQSRPVACVLLPFAAGYYLSYLFRSINALIASDLVAELEINAADLGLLTSVYFLVFAVVQLPFGVLLDRHGPKTIQSALVLVASSGALIFALADGLIGLIVGRAVLSLGVALALMAGFKAIVLWFPPERIVLANGWYVMLGALGAVTATAPAELVVQSLGWRRLFALLAGLSAPAALPPLLRAPRPPRLSRAHGNSREPLGHLSRPALLAHGAALRHRHRHVLVAAGPVGCAVAAGCRGPRPRQHRRALERHGVRGLHQR